MRPRARQPSHCTCSCMLWPRIAEATTAMAAGTCAGSTRPPSWPSASESRTSRMALRPATCTRDEAAWSCICSSTTGKPAITAEAQEKSFCCRAHFITSSSTASIFRKRSLMPPRARLSGARQAGALAAMWPKEATAACAVIALLEGPVASMSSDTPRSITGHAPGEMCGDRTFSTPPKPCRTFSATSPLMSTRSARLSNASAAWGNCCWRDSSGGSQASLAIVTRPLITAGESSGALDIT
mmetsp:Transcript_86883/g.243162  ORF Transcript_86883/g.243162 Transcript_86883/m.243162 type:complete len:241 (+) Transcript_86883:142-864(+)